MPWTIAALDPATGSRGLLAEVHPERADVPDAVLRDFCRRLFQRNVRVGLVITPTVVVVLRDTLSSMQLRDNRFERLDLSTPTLLAHAQLGAPRADAAFMKQIVTWLEAVASSWHSFLHDSAVAAMVPDVVGHLAGANLEVWEGLLEAHDAAE